MRPVAASTAAAVTTGAAVSAAGARAPSTLWPAPAASAAWVREASRSCASLSVAPPDSTTISCAAVRVTSTPSASLSACTTAYSKESARARPDAAPPVTSDAVRTVPPTSRRTAISAPVADTSHSTSADHVARTRITSPRP